MQCAAAGGAQPLPVPTRLSAATAHRATDAYLACFDALSGDVGRLQQQQQQDGLTLCTAQPLSLPRAQPVRPADCATASRASSASAAAAGAAATASGPAGCCWQQPPSLAARLQLSERNLLCASVDWGRQEAVLGSADHAAYSLDLAQRTKRRTLYTKAAGHREWVTAVAHLPEGRVATGGQDAAIWLWGGPSSGGRPAGEARAAAAAACTATRLEGHTAPVSQLEALPAAAATAEGGALVSASYDKRVIVWACGGGSSGSASGGSARPRQLQVLSGHRAPVLQLRLAGRLAASGDRDGAVQRWDLAAGAALGRPLPAHNGHCTALEWWDTGGCSDSGSCSTATVQQASLLLLTGGQDGCVRAWDSRQGGQAAPLWQAAAHAGPAGRGAVGSIVAGLPGGAAHLVATAGADCTVQGLDSRRGLEAAWVAQLPDFPYCLAATAGMLLVGCGDGTVAALDAASGEQRWSIAASSSAIRTLHASAYGGVVLAGCDDGSAVIYAAAGPV